MEYPHKQEAFDYSVNSIAQKFLMGIILNSRVEKDGTEKAVENVK